MKHIHLILDSTYADDFISFVCSHFNRDEHLFYVLKTTGRCCVIDNPNQDKIKYVRRRNLMSVISSVGKNNHFIVHGLFDNILVGILFVRKDLLRRCSIVMWGADLYWHKKVADKSSFDYKKTIDLLRKYIYQNVGQLAFDMPTDYELMKKWYGIDRDIVYITYPQIINEKQITDALERKLTIERDDTINIIVGNSATDTNRHKEAFEFLEHFKKENIRIICPLSYGDETYSNEVVKYGSDIFGEKFKPLLNYMSSNDYIEMMSRIDVAIFHNNRQQAMGNITLAACLGAKVYISQETSMWRQYVEVGGCCFNRTEGVRDMSFDKFIKIEETEKNKNKNYFMSVLNTDNMIKKWSPIIGYTL